MSNVLIVEDDLMNARLFEMVLKRLGGFDVRISARPEEVIELASQGRVGVIIMDVSLSGCTLDGKPVNGLEICRLLKEKPETRRIPVILATAHSMEGDRERFLKLSLADDYIPKPICDHAYLVEKVRKHLERQNPTGAEEEALETSRELDPHASSRPR